MKSYSTHCLEISYTDNFFYSNGTHMHTKINQKPIFGFLRTFRNDGKHSYGSPVKIISGGYQKLQEGGMNEHNRTVEKHHEKRTDHTDKDC